MPAIALTAPLLAMLLTPEARLQQPSEVPLMPQPRGSHRSVDPRLAEDLAQVCRQLQQAPVTFDGHLLFGSSPPGEIPDELDKQFVGGCRDGLNWFAMDDWRVVARGERTAVAHGDRAWTKPQGDTPEAPLTPRLFAGMLATAELGTPAPAAYADRPAMMVYARWTGEAAKDVIWTTSVPSSKHEALLQAIATTAARGNPNVVVDAVVRYDPASRTWLATTLRMTLLDGKALPFDEPPIAAPDGLPPLPSSPMAHVLIRLGRCAAERAPLPELDPTANAILSLPGAGRAK